MTQYLLSVHGDGTNPYESDEAMQQAFARVSVFNEELRQNDSWVFAGGLMPVTTATVVDATGAEPLITDGPYAETKEHLGGFWIIEAPDLDAALEVATRGSAACGNAVEVRPLQGE